MSFKEISDKVKAELQLLRKPAKYVFYGLVLLVVLGIGSCTLKGCGNNNKAAIYNSGTEYPQAQQVVTQPVPQQIIVQQPSNGPHVGSLVTGAAVGALVHRALSKPAVAPAPVVHKTIIKKYYSPSKSYRRKR